MTFQMRMERKIDMEIIKILAFIFTWCLFLDNIAVWTDESKDLRYKISKTGTIVFLMVYTLHAYFKM